MKTKKVKYLILASWIAICALFGYFSPTLPVVKEIFSVKKVTVLGTDKFQKEDIKRIFERENWFFLNKDKVREELLKYNFVKEVQINRLFVGSVNLIILERKPFAVLYHKGTKKIIDEDGNKIETKFYPDINISILPKVIYNDKSINPEKLRKIKKINENFSKIFNVKKYIVNKSQITCVLDGGRTVVFSTEDLDKSIRRGKIFFSRKNINDFSYINLSFESMIVVRR
ncbi:cell division protein FtsQ/DivIB [Persephonella sp.]